MKDKIIIYTDGASRGNPGAGGWAAIVSYSNKVKELVGAKNAATNNQMELQAVISGLTFAKEIFNNEIIELHADSNYVLNGLEKWLMKWQKNGWMTMAKKPVENKNLWEELLILQNIFKNKINLVKVEGHSGHVYNDRCDELAVNIAQGKDIKLFEGTIEEYESILELNKPKSEIKKRSVGSKNSAKVYSYVSLVDNKVFVDKDWTDCKKRVNGKNAKYKKVFSKDEETSLIQDYTLQTLI